VINDVIVEKVINIDQKIPVVKPLCSVSKLFTESVGSPRELVANSPTRRSHATRQLRRVGGVYWA